MTDHWASLVPPLQPLVFPGGHAGGLELLPDHALLRPILHLLQPTQRLFVLHVTAKSRETMKKQRYTHYTASCMPQGIENPFTINECPKQLLGRSKVNEIQQPQDSHSPVHNRQTY